MQRKRRRRKRKLKKNMDQRKRRRKRASKQQQRRRRPPPLFFCFFSSSSSAPFSHVETSVSILFFNLVARDKEGRVESCRASRRASCTLAAQATGRRRIPPSFFSFFRSNGFSRPMRLFFLSFSLTSIVAAAASLPSPSLSHTLLPPRESGTRAETGGTRSSERERQDKDALLLSLFSHFFLKREGEKAKRRRRADSKPKKKTKAAKKKRTGKKTHFFPFSSSSMNGRAGSLAAALVAAASRSRAADARFFVPVRSLTADAALAEQQQQRQEKPRSQDNLADANENALDDDADNEQSSRARRLREMEASSSSSHSSRLRDSLPSADEVSARLRGSLGGRKGAFPSRAAAAAPPLVVDDRNNDVSNNKNVSPESPLRDWRDALEAARELDAGGDPLTDTFG